MKVKLKSEWLGHKKGTVLNLTPLAARRLIDMKKADEHEEKGASKKSVDSPPKDKMVRRPVRKKRKTLTEV